MDAVKERGLALLGCGKMGSAMLAGWLSEGVAPSSVTVIEPSPSEWLRSTGVNLVETLPSNPGVLVVAVKPQIMAKALAGLDALSDTLVISIAAGTPLATFEAAFGADTPVVRAMPNTPAAIGKGITALVGNAKASEAHLATAETLLAAVGQVVRLDDEGLMDAVTAVSGSGPAYVFHLIEAMAAAGEAEGLPPATALHLARATVAGAGALAEAADEGPDQLRVNVTSPGGTTAAALWVLMDETTGLPPLMAKAVAAAAARGRELGK